MIEKPDPPKETMSLQCEFWSELCCTALLQWGWCAAVTCSPLQLFSWCMYVTVCVGMGACPYLPTLHKRYSGPSALWGVSPCTVPYIKQVTSTIRTVTSLSCPFKGANFTLLQDHCDLIVNLWPISSFVDNNPVWLKTQLKWIIVAKYYLGGGLHDCYGTPRSQCVTPQGRHLKFSV